MKAKHAFGTSCPHLFLLSLLLLGCRPPSALAQTCPLDDIVFDQQDVIDAFPKDYPGCTKIPGNVTIQESLPGGILQIDSLYPISQIMGNLVIDGNTILPDLKGLAQLQEVGGNMDLLYNSQLTHLRDLTQLQHIRRNLYIIDNQQLQNLQGLDSLQTVGRSLIINRNPQLQSLKHLTKLSSLGNNLILSENESLVSLAGLQQISKVFNLEVVENPRLKNLAGLEQLQQIIGQGWIRSNDSLENLVGLASLNSIIGGLNILSNPRLSDLGGMPELHKINGDLVLAGLDSLRSLTGLEPLKEITLTLRISFNPNLETLGGLENLRKLRVLSLSTNSSLVDIEALRNIWPGSLRELIIETSPLLAYCAWWPICQHLSDPDHKAIFFANAEGCSNREEVEEACLINQVEEAEPVAWTIYPNPTDRWLTVEGLAEGSEVQLYSPLGQLLVRAPVNGQLDLGYLPAGIYQLVLVRGGSRYLQRVVKVE